MTSRPSNTDRKRVTKNSLKVAAFENQNKIIEQVLEESKKLDKNSSMSKSNSNPSGGNKPENTDSNVEPTDQGRSATITVEGNPEKKLISESTQTSFSGSSKGVGNEQIDKDSYVNPMREFWGRKQILPYPGYDNVDSSGSGSNRFNESIEPGWGNVGEVSAGNGKASCYVTKATRTSRTIPAAAGSSSNKMEAPFLFNDVEHQISDNSEDELDYERGPNDWDNNSLASSAIFQDSEDRREIDNSKTSANAKALGQPGQEKKTGNEIERLIREKAGKDSADDKTGPPVADFVADMLKVFIKAPDTEGIFKLIDNYPRPSNAEWLKTPQLGKQVAASIPKRSNNYDKKLKQTQMCMGAALTASTRVLQGLMEKANEDESLIPLGRLAVDALNLGAYVHSDLNTIRKGAIRQVVNPNYAGVFTRRTTPTPDSLLGENSVPDQIKEYDEINKVRAKLQKNQERARCG